jgi:ABC-type nickel/cobalt efflux system permease component RcnA
MGNLKTQIKLTIALGWLSLLAGVLTVLALTDIYHGETYVVQEWNMVRIASFVLPAFIVMALFTLRRALRELP